MNRWMSHHVFFLQQKLFGWIRILCSVACLYIKWLSYAMLWFTNTVREGMRAYTDGIFDLTA